MTEEPKQPLTRAKIETPCVQICEIDETSGLCRGCGRSRREIGGWSRMSSEERRAIMAVLPERLKEMR